MNAVLIRPIDSDPAARPREVLTWKEGVYDGTTQEWASLRQRIQPVAPEDFLSFLVRRHRLQDGQHWIGAVGVREAIAQLQGFDLPAGAWENRILRARVAQYDRSWLDQLFLAGGQGFNRMASQPRQFQQFDYPLQADVAIAAVS